MHTIIISLSVPLRLLIPLAEFDSITQMRISPYARSNVDWWRYHKINVIPWSFKEEEFDTQTNLENVCLMLSLKLMKYSTVVIGNVPRQKTRLEFLIK